MLFASNSSLSCVCGYELVCSGHRDESDFCDPFGDWTLCTTLNQSFSLRRTGATVAPSGCSMTVLLSGGETSTVILRNFSVPT